MIAHPNLKAYYRYETLARIGKDASGNGFTLTNNGGTIGTGKYGNGVVLDGASNYLINTDYVNIRPLKDFTLESWLYIEPGNVNIVAPISVGPTSGIIFGYFSSGAMRFYVRTAAGFKYFNLPAVDVPIQTLTHFAQTYDGINIKLYINGNFYGQLAQTGNVKYVGTIGLKIGTYNSTVFFKGKLDETRLWHNKAYPESDIKRMMYNFNPLT